MSRTRDLVRRTYTVMYRATSDQNLAFACAVSAFRGEKGRMPTRTEIDALLHGAILGDDHPLMKLLDACAYSGQIDDSDVPPDHPLFGS